MQAHIMSVTASAIATATATTTVHNHLLSDASGEQGFYTGPVVDMSAAAIATKNKNNTTITTTTATATMATTTTTTSTTSRAPTTTITHPLLPHGSYGDFRYENGRRYKGDWKHGQWHGNGQAWFTNGDSYEGQYVHDQRHGKGLYRWRDGRIYEGDFQKDLRHGQGRYQWLDGTVYEGAFEKGQQQGKGTSTLKDGTYTGHFDRGQYHGYGVCKYNDGRKYKGEWNNGMRHGHGEETDEDGLLIHKGEWRDDEPYMSRGETQDSAHTVDSEVSEVEEQQQLNPVVNIEVLDSRNHKGSFRGMLLRGVPHSVGHMVYEGGDIDTYQGFWDYGDWKQGRLEYRNGDTYDGEFENNRRSGSGRYIWADGREYQGEWKADLRNGQGKFHFPNGDVFEGSFVAGARHGFGRFEFHDNSLFEGSFKRGEFHGHGCKYVHRDGRVYLGDFSEGARNGYGKELFPDGSLRYEGEWIHDEPTLPAKVNPPPEGFVLIDADDPEDVADKNQLVDISINSKPSTTVPSIFIQTKDCKTVVDEKMMDAVGNEGKFTGLVLNGRPHGVGRMVYDGEIREGFWKYGHLDGHARAFFELGDFYEGMFVDSLREGVGVYKWSDGRVYEGEYKKDLRHGQGRFIYATGDEYVGGYEHGMRCGKGKFTFADGSSYVGDWKNSLYDGYGVLKNIDGSVYKGEWKEGTKHGHGQYRDENTHSLWNGEWEDDSFIKAVEVPEKDEEKTVAEPATAVVRAQSGDLCFELLDGEHHRWKPVVQDDDTKGDNSELLLVVQSLESESDFTSKAQAPTRSLNDDDVEEVHVKWGVDSDAKPSVRSLIDDDEEDGNVMSAVDFDPKATVQSSTSDVEKEGKEELAVGSDANTSFWSLIDNDEGQVNGEFTVDSDAKATLLIHDDAKEATRALAVAPEAGYADNSTHAGVKLLIDNDVQGDEVSKTSGIIFDDQCTGNAEAVAPKLDDIGLDNVEEAA